MPHEEHRLPGVVGSYPGDATLNGWNERLSSAVTQQRRASPDTARQERLLSEREMELLRCLANGMESKAIGARLSLGESALKRHLRSIFDKLGVGNRTHAVAEAYRRKLL